MESQISRRSLLRGLASSGAAAMLSSIPGLSQEGRSKRLGVCSISYALRWPAVNRGQGSIEEFLQFIEHCRSLGAGGVQTSISPEREFVAQAKSKIEESNLYLEAQISLPSGETDLERFETRIVAAKEAGASVVRTACLGGRRYELFKDAATFADFARKSEQALLLAEPVVRKHRMRLAVENHKDWRVPEMLQLLSRIGSEYVGVCLDTGNNIALMEDPMTVVQALAPYAFATHLKDMAVQEYEKGFFLSEVPLGEGFLDLHKIVQTLRNSKPDLQFTLEMITRDPLPVPCLTKPYWATFENMPAWILAGALSMIRGNASRKTLPQISGLSQEEKLEAEDKAVRTSLAFARKELQL